MAIRPDYTTGTITLTNASTAVTGTGTSWASIGLKAGDTIFQVVGQMQYEAVIDTVDSNTSLTLRAAWAGSTVTDVAYAIRFQPDGSRYSAAAAALLEQLASGNITAFSGLVGEAGKVPMFTGPGAMTLMDGSEFVNGVEFDVQVDNLAARATYNGQATGFKCLVSNNGDGRAALYSKNSASSGDWSDPAYITGPTVTLTVDDVVELAYADTPTFTLTPVSGGYEVDVGLPGPATVVVGSTTTLDPGDNATVVGTPNSGGISLAFGIPAGEGFRNQGNYNGATAYIKGDTVLYNGTSYIAKSPTTGNVPTNATYWDVLAEKGADGADGIDGTGVVSELIAGFGIVVDDTDPTQPIIAVSDDARQISTRSKVTSSNASYAVPAGATHVRVSAVGGGGGGAGSAATAAGNASVGGGGGSGASGVTDWLDLTGITTLNISIGAGGAAIAGSSGGTGGDTTVTVGSTTYTFPGGVGGQASGAASTMIFVFGGGGGAAGTNVDTGSESGGTGFALATIALSGHGGGSPWGTGGPQRRITSGGFDGYAASGYGSGGGGGCNSQSVGTTSTGAAGKPGVVFLEWEFGKVS